MIIVELIFNLSILVALSVFSGFIGMKFRKTGSTGKILQGILFGSVAAIGMIYPYIYSTEISFDGRTIAISLCTLFFGPISGAVAVIITSISRISIGGDGVVPGLVLIITSYAIGLIYHKWNLKSNFDNLSARNLFLFGIVIHIAMLVIASISAEESFINNFPQITLMVLGMYPLITMISGKVLLDQERNIKYINEISEREQLYRTTLYSIGDAVITTDIEGKILNINTVAERVTGWTEKEIQGQPLKKVFNILNEITKEPIESPVDKVLQEGSIVGLENNIILISKEGKRIPITDSAAPIYDSNGEINGVVLVFRDQTKERQAKLAVEESEKKFREIINSINEAIFIHDAETGQIIDVNDAMLRIFGIDSKEEALKTSFEKLSSDKPGYTFENAVALIRKSYEEGPQVFEWLGKKLNGEEFWMEVSLRSTLIEGIIRVLAVARDITGRKNAEREIREATELRKAILDNASYSIISTNKEGIIISFNPAAESLTGYSASEVINKYTPEILHDREEMKYRAEIFSKEVGEKVFPDFNLFVVKAIHNLPNEHEWTYIRKDGSKFRVLLSVTPICDSNNEVIGYLGIANDISDRKKSEEMLALRTQELKESEEKYRTLFEQSKDAMLIIDNNLFIDCNEAALDMMRFKSKEELFNTHPSALSPPVQPDGKLSFEKAEEMMTIAKKNGSHRFEWVHRKVSGEDFYVEVTLTIIPYKQKQIIHTTWRDISDRKNAEEKILKLSKGIEQSPATVIISDKEGVIEYVNPKFTEITGYSFREVFGQNLRTVKSGIHDKEIFNDLWETITSGKMWRGELLNKKKSGEEFWEHVSISPIKNENGDITNYIAIEEDISQRKKMMEDLIQAKEKAEKTNQLKSEFLAQMSHEIRSPINTMVSFTSLIEEEVRNEKNSELEVCFTGIEAASKRVIRTIDLILNMSELQLGTYEINKREVNLSDVLHNLVIEYKKIASLKHLKLKYDFEEKNVIINSDEYAVNQIFANLLDNAIKYTNQGSVGISINEANGGGIIVKVSDTGIGISPEYLEDLFEPFSQEEQGYSRRFEGNGLGMSLVKRYCDLINADIKVESEKGNGTEFTVVINN